MGSIRNLVESIVRLPTRALDPILSAESDWIRYGVPALVLTVIFFVLMRTQAPTTESSAPPPSSAEVAAKSPLHSKLNPFSAAPAPPASPPDEHSHNSPPPEQPPAAPANEVASQPPPASGSFGQTQGGAAQQTAARLALCNAVRYAATKPPQSRSRLAMTMAMQTYRGPGASRDAVMQALADYRRGGWSDEQCPTPLGVTPLRHGMIGSTIK